MPDDRTHESNTCQTRTRKGACTNPAVGHDRDVNGEYPMAYCERHKPLSAASADLESAVNDLGRALWKERAGIRWFFVVTAAIGVMVGLYGWSMGYQGVAEFGAAFGSTSLTALTVLRLIEWRRRDVG